MKAFTPEDNVLASGVELKSNRDGYLLPKNKQSYIEFEPELVDKYNVAYSEFVMYCDLVDDLHEAEAFILSQAKLAMQAIQSHGGKHSELISRITQNINFDNLNLS
jgi:hypothetical protein